MHFRPCGERKADRAGGHRRREKGLRRNVEKRNYGCRPSYGVQCPLPGLYFRRTSRSGRIRRKNRGLSEKRRGWLRYHPWEGNFASAPLLYLWGGDIGGEKAAEGRGQYPAILWRKLWGSGGFYPYTLCIHERRGWRDLVCGITEIYYFRRGGKWCALLWLLLYDGESEGHGSGDRWQGQGLYARSADR